MKQGVLFNSYKAVIIFPAVIFVGVLIGSKIIVMQRESRCEERCASKGMGYEYQDFTKAPSLNSSNLKSDKCNCIDRIEPDTNGNP